MIKKFIAVTGGIGSGKSTLLGLFKAAGYPIFSADEIYAELLRNEEFVQLVSLSVGVEPIKTENGLKLDREKIAEKVFSDGNLLKNLNEVTHGAIMTEMQNRAKHEDKTVFCEVPLLFEGSYEKLFDLIIVVRRSDEDRIKAVEIRDGKTKEKVKKIIENQFDYSKIIEDGHTIIVENDGDLSALKVDAEKILDFVNSKI